MIDEEGQKCAIELVASQFIIFRADHCSRKTQLGRFDGKHVVPLVYKKKPYGVTPRNMGQHFLQEALMTDAASAPLVIVKGKAGAAKTFYVLAVGLNSVMELEEPEYRRVDQNEKECFADERSPSGKLEELFARVIINVQALSFIRGRPVARTYLIIGETQNLTPKQANGIITRAGVGTKVILLEYLNQIDHPLPDERTNGLSYAA